MVALSLSSEYGSTRWCKAHSTFLWVLGIELWSLYLHGNCFMHLVSIWREVRESKCMYLVKTESLENSRVRTLGVVSYPVWVLGNKLRAPEREVCALNC